MDRQPNIIEEAEAVEMSARQMRWAVKHEPNAAAAKRAEALEGAAKTLRALAGVVSDRSPVEQLAGEIASDVFPWVPEQTLDKWCAIRERVQGRLECGQGRELIRRMAGTEDD